MYLLENPEVVASSGYISFVAGLWFWMTPQSPKPSMHDVITGFWVPNAADRKAGMKRSANGLNCFGTTTNIINGGIECGGAHNTGSENRGLYFNDWLKFFGLPTEGSSAYCLGCKYMTPHFPSNGSASMLSYFDQDWSGKNRCKLVTWQTGYSLFARDDYKRCVCDKWGKGAANCQT